jgi:hypothetical protein
MNCAECRDNLIACAEGLLKRGEEQECRAHLEACAECRAEYEAMAGLQRRLIARGQAAAGVGIAGPVMTRLRREQFKIERETFMSKLLNHRWGLGLGAAACVAAILAVVLLTMPGAQAQASAVLVKGAQAAAKLTSIHLRGQLRTYPQDNFSAIVPDQGFAAIELWKQFEPELKWRVEKPGRVAVMDGQSAVLYIKPGNFGTKYPHPTPSAFDTEWLQRIANLGNTISNELRNAKAKGWQLSVAAETAADGRSKSVVTVMAKSGLPDNDYLKNSFLDSADTRRVYRFDDRSEMLEAAQIYLERASGETLIFDLSQIDCNQPIDPGVWKLELPADVSWAQLEPPRLANNEQYASMTAEQAARAFFEACGRKDWDEAGKFMSPITDGIKEYLGGLEIVSLGDSFSSVAYAGRFVPYEIKLQAHAQVFNVRVSNNNAAKRYVVTGVFDSQGKLQEGVKWANEPESLAGDDPDARLSPAGVVKAYFQASINSDWAELRKFTTDSDVEQTKAQVEEAKKAGLDLASLMPVTDEGDAVWSAEQSAYLVKCHLNPPASQSAFVKKHNLALRKDNPAGRWQVDGGI